MYFTKITTILKPRVELKASNKCTLLKQPAPLLFSATLELLWYLVCMFWNKIPCGIGWPLPSSAAEADLDVLLILLPLPSGYWDHSALPFPTLCVALGIEEFKGARQALLSTELCPKTLETSFKTFLCCWRWNPGPQECWATLPLSYIPKPFLCLLQVWTLLSYWWTLDLLLFVSWFICWFE